MGPGSHRRLQASAIAMAVAAGGCGAAVMAGGAPSASASKKSAATPTSPGAINLRAVPLGDGYVSTTPRVGYVDSCVTQFGSGGGAQVNGPWIDTTNHTWDYRTKLAVNGSVQWPTASYKLASVAGKRKITFNDLPVDHRTGVFPIATTDPAYKYDHNPNHIAAQTFSWSLPRNPKPAGKSSCTPLGPIGVLKDGVVLYDALDAQGRDAGAHEVLDRCAGHPDPSDTYHHHDVPPCILDKTQNGRSTVVGFALDGFGIYVTRNRDGVMPTNTQLDACHGTTSKVDWNGHMVRIYHYVATLEYPYTIGCFRGTPISSGRGGGPAAEGPPGGGPPGRGTH